MNQSAVKPLRFAALAAAALSSLTATAALPSGYTQLTYIASSGSQYINTGIAPKTTTRVVCDFQYTVVNGSAQCGWGSTNNKEAFLFGVGSDNTFRVSVSGNFTASPTGVAADTARHAFDLSTSALKLDGTAFTNASSSPFSNAASGNTLYLFALHAGWSPYVVNKASMRIYSCQIYDSDTLVRDFIPVCRISDMEVGLYDSVNNMFYKNEGTGSFTMGDIVLSSDTLDITAFPDGIGSPSPAYGVTNGLASGASFTVSCGTTSVTNAAGQYSCTGWKLYDETGAVVSNGVETSFTYTHPYPAAYRRIEWQWETISVTWYNTWVNSGWDTTAAGTCLVGNPGLWKNFDGESATSFSTDDLYVVSGGQTLRMGEVASLRTFAGGTMRFGNNGTAGNFTHDNHYALSFPRGLILVQGKYNFNKSPATSDIRVGVMNGGRVEVRASEQNPFSLYSNFDNRYLVFNNDIATESDSNVLSLGGSTTNFTFFAMGDLSGYTGRIVVDYTGSGDVRWATRICIGERSMPGTIQVKGKTAISAWSGVLTNPQYADTMPTRSPCACTVGSLEMESGSVICVEGRNKTSTLAATNGLIRVSTAFLASSPVYVRPDWAVEVTKDNPDVTVLTVPASQELSKADFMLDTTGLEITQELVLEVRNEGLEKQLVITKKGMGLAIFVR